MKLALIGTGKIIEDALFAMEPVETIERTAIFARPHSRDKAEKFAKQYAIKEVYTDYEELLEKTEADTAYDFPKRLGRLLQIYASVESRTSFIHAINPVLSI